MLVENALTSMGQRLEKVEHDVETLESHMLSQLDQVKEDMESSLNSEEERAGRIDLFEKKDMYAISSMQAQLDVLKMSLEETRSQAQLLGARVG